MNPRSLGALIVLNVALLLALVVVTFSPAPAQAQFGGRADYVMISGFSAGRENQALYPGDQQTMAAQTVLNAQNQPVSSIRDSNQRFFKDGLHYVIELLAAREVAADVAGGAGRMGR